MWKLIREKSIDWPKDNSGIYTIINRQDTNGQHKEFAGLTREVRIDVMSTKDDPIVSFVGCNHEDLRKAE